jgi:hypothetical protein
VSTFLFASVVFGTITGLYVWAQRRAQAIREQAERREQSAMALMLAGGEVADANNDAPEAPPPRKIVGRLLEDDPSEKAAAAARHAAAKVASDNAKRELPPLEYGHSKQHAKSKYAKPHNGQIAQTPAEEAAAELDPIEDLISQIMVHEPAHRSAARPAPTPAPRSIQPTAPKRDGVAPMVPLRELVLAWYESRGYRGSPASPAVWPIELVLRHRDDAARAYAFVVQNDHVSVDRITARIASLRSSSRRAKSEWCASPLLQRPATKRARRKSRSANTCG